MSFIGHVQNGVVVFDEPITLQEGTEVEVAVRRPQNRGDETIIKSVAAESGLCYEGNVLVHRGTCTTKNRPLEAERDERMEQLSQGLPQ
jgi:predicted DNA-binding antitoxin AbrB/MazE fold protein